MITDVICDDDGIFLDTLHEKYDKKK